MSKPATETEKRNATSEVARLPKKQRTPARIEVAVAKQRILTDQYGMYDPATNRVSEAASDMGLNQRQKQTLRELLRDTDEQVRVQKEHSCDHGSRYSDPARIAHDLQLAASLDLLPGQFLVQSEWLRINTPTLLE
jgi:hypothetical protein